MLRPRPPQLQKKQGIPQLYEIASGPKYFQMQGFFLGVPPEPIYSASLQIYQFKGIF